MTLLKTSFLIGIANVIKIITSFIMAKVVAVQVGPAGMALIGQFNNFIGISTSIAGSINNGVIKYISEYYDSDTKRINILKNAFWITTLFSLIISLITFFYRENFSLYLLKSKDYSFIFLLFSLFLFFFSYNNLLISLFNGFKEIKKYVLTGIITNIVSFLLSIFFVYYYGIYGVLVSIAIAQSIVFIITLFFALNSKWFSYKNFTFFYDNDSVIKLLKFSIMALVSALTVPITQILIRNFIIHKVSIDAAGMWQAILNISNVYLMIITTSLSVYYLPRLSEIKDVAELKKEIFNGYKIIIPIVLFLTLGIYFAKYLIIKILFSTKFSPMSILFKYQCIGDFFKISSWLLGYIAVAKAMTKLFVFLEIVQNINYLVLSVIFVNAFGLIGVSYSYALLYFIHFIILIFVFRKIIFINKKMVI